MHKFLGCNVGARWEVKYFESFKDKVNEIMEA